MKKRMLIVGVLTHSITYPMAKTAPVAKTAPAMPIVTGTPNQMQITVPGKPDAQGQSNPPVIVNVNNNLSNKAATLDISGYNVNQSQNSNQQSQQQSTQMVQQHVVQRTFTYVKTEILERATKAQEYAIALREWIRLNSIKVTIGAGIAGYLASVAQLVRMNYYLADDALWARWRYEDSYEQLCQMPAKELARDLIFSIQRRYTTQKQFTDFIHPLVQFLHDLEEEKKTLRRYISIGKWIMKFRLDYILPINQKKINLAKKLLQRVYFFEHIFLSWAAEFKIQQNTSS